MTNTHHNHTKGMNSMKKMLLVAVMVVALVFAFAATAMARPNPNIYIDWDNTTFNGAAGPHAGYATASEKCNVCHAVHYAATSDFDSVNTPTNASYQGNWVSGPEETQMLLRSSVGNACNYCHIDTNVGGVQIWGGDSANYDSADASGAFSHSHAACVDCHAVHGASTFKGGNESKILRVRADRPIQTQVLGTAPDANGIVPLFADTAAAVAAADKYTQQVAFCSQCHAEYTTSSEATIAGYSYYSASPATPYKGHPMVADITSFSAAGDTTPLTQVAYANSQTCRTCHDAGGTGQSGVSFNSFPHYTRGFYRFQTSGANAGVVDADAATLLGDASNTTPANAEDGLCIKCHINAAGTDGVGLTY